MKKLFALLLAVVMVMGLVACGGQPAEDSKPADGNQPTANADKPAEGGKLNVGVFYYTYDDPYIASVRSALDAKWSELGVQYTNNDCKGDQATQNDLIQTAITNGANLLVVNLVNSGNPDAAKKVIEIAGDIPVLFFNRAVEEAGKEGTVLGQYNNVGFIGTDAPEAGHLQGKIVGDFVLANFDALDLNKDGKLTYAMFKGDEGNAEAIARTQYGIEDANKVLTEAGKPAMEYFKAGAKTLYQVDQSAQWSTQAALDYMTTNLAEYNESNKNMIEVVICNNDGMAEGVIKALNAAGYNLGDGKSTVIPVFGVDATDSAKQLIADGKMTGTVKQDAEGMANAIAHATKSISEGKTVVEALAAAAETNKEIYSIANGYDSKLYVAYAPYTGE